MDMSLRVRESIAFDKIESRREFFITYIITEIKSLRIQQVQGQQYKSNQSESQGFKKPNYNNRSGNNEERSFRYEEKEAKGEVNPGGAKKWDYRDPKIQFLCP